jgi:DDE superfamily endonuclease
VLVVGHTPGVVLRKHHTTGLNVQVACTVADNWRGFPTLSTAAVMTPTASTNPASWPTSPKTGSATRDMSATTCLLPSKNAHRDLADWEKEFNKQINKIRYVIERVIANFKTWRIIHTDYRRPLGTFTQTISTVIALHFYKLTYE